VIVVFCLVGLIREAPILAIIPGGCLILAGVWMRSTVQNAGEVPPRRPESAKPDDRQKHWWTRGSSRD
jgi:hypothetical protein